MKKNLTLFLAILFLAVSCSESENHASIQEVKAKEQQEVETQEAKENFDWLLGKWKRSNEDDGKETFEVWEKKSLSFYKGLGFTMQKGDTIKQEKIQLVKSKGQWLLHVLAGDEPQPTTFPMYTFTETEFICKNPNIGFPQLIKYHIVKDKLYAIVASEEMEIFFEMEKIED